MLYNCEVEILIFKTSCAVLAYLSSNLLNEVGLSLFRYFEVCLRVCDIVVKKFTFAISSPDEFLFYCLLCVFCVLTFFSVGLPMFSLLVFLFNCIVGMGLVA